MVTRIRKRAATLTLAQAVGLTVGLMTIATGVVGGGWRVLNAYAAHVRAEERRDEQIRVLRQIIVSELPQYTLAVYPPGDDR